MKRRIRITPLKPPEPKEEICQDRPPEVDPPEVLTTAPQYVLTGVDYAADVDRTVMSTHSVNLAEALVRLGRSMTHTPAHTVCTTAIDAVIPQEGIGGRPASASRLFTLCTDIDYRIETMSTWIRLTIHTTVNSISASLPSRIAVEARVPRYLGRDEIDIALESLAADLIRTAGLWPVAMAMDGYAPRVYERTDDSIRALHAAAYDSIRRELFSAQARLQT